MYKTALSPLLTLTQVKMELLKIKGKEFLGILLGKHSAFARGLPSSGIEHFCNCGKKYISPKSMANMNAMGIFAPVWTCTR